MAKFILWVLVIFNVIVSVFLATAGEEVEPFTKIALISMLGVLALCESIEERNRT